MSQETTENNHFSPFYLKMGLLVVLLTSGAIIIYSVNWIYDKILDRLGLDIAEVVVAFLAVLIVILILLGFGAGLGADQIVRRHKVQTHRIYRALRRSRVLRSLWQYIGPTAPKENAERPAIEVISIPERPPRRGRRPTYSLDRWVRVVHAWENRDPLRNTMTLAEFLAEEFGTYADGSPQMSENSYYEWRKKVFLELHKQESGKKDQADA